MGSREIVFQHSSQILNVSPPCSLERITPPQVDRIELRAFGSVLCHTAEIRIQAIERVTRT